jgi:cytochrome P450
MKTRRLAFLAQSARDFGGIVRFAAPGRAIYLVSEPAAARHILVTNCANYVKGLGQRETSRLIGEGLLTADTMAWRSQRRAFEGLFSASRMEDLARTVVPAVERLSSSWATCAAERKTTDLIRDVRQLALSMVDGFLLADGLGPRISMTIGKLQEFERLVTAEVLALWPSVPNIPFGRSARLREVISALHRIIDEVIDHCAAVGGDNIVTWMRRQGLSAPDDRALRSHVATFLLTAYETTAAALAWVWYLLDRHPSKAEKLRAELRLELGGKAPALDHIGRLSYTRGVVLEALRLFPPVWVIPRTAIQADAVCGFAIPARTEILISPYLIHRRAELWPDPDDFLPERFAAKSLQADTPCAYLPFGAGPRSCIGSQLATIELILAIALLAQRFRLSRAGGSRFAPEVQLSLFPGAAVSMRVHAA